MQMRSAHLERGNMFLRLPEVHYARLMITLVRGRAAAARREGRNEIGASAIEWAIISAIVVTLAILVATKIQDLVTKNADKIDDGANG